MAKKIDTDRISDRIIFFFAKRNEREILLLLLGTALLLRLYPAFIAPVITNDGAAYGFMARDFSRGDLTKALSSVFHPLYPFIISIFSRDPMQVDTVGRLVSLFFGTFALLPIFFAFKRAFGRGIAIFSVLFYCFHPYLVKYSGMLLSEATYWGLLTSSVCLFWFGLKIERILYILASSALLGLSYLTRPEGIGYLVVFLLWIAVESGISKNWSWKVLNCGLFVIIFFLVAGPYILHLRNETGMWLISKKSPQSQAWLISMNRGRSNAPATEPIMRSNEPTAQKSDDKTTEIAKDQKSFRNEAFDEFQHPFWRWIHYLPYTAYHYLKAYHLTLWVFLFLGLTGARGWKKREELFFGSFVVFHILSLATFTPSISRFALPLVPITLFWAGRGVLEFVSILERMGVACSKRWTLYLIVIVFIVQLTQCLKPEERRWKDDPVVAWLKENTPPNALVLSNSPKEAFYANRNFLYMPYRTATLGRDPSYDEVLSYAKANGADYVLIDRFSREFSPGFVNRLPSDEIKEVFRHKYKDGSHTIIYRIKHKSLSE